MIPAGQKLHSSGDDRLLEMAARDLRFDSDQLERLAELLVAAEGSWKDDVQGEQTPYAGLSSSAG